MPNTRPKLQGRDHRLGGSDPIPPGRWYYVGAADAPAFQNSWANAGAGARQLRFRRTNENQIEIVGSITGGADNTVVFSLAGWWFPDEQEWLVGATDDSTVVVFRLEADGDVVFVGEVSGGSTITAGDGLSDTAGTFAVNADGSTLEISSDTLRVKDGGITVAKLSFDPATQTELDAHVTDATDAHDASAISIVDAGNFFTGIQVEAALQELAAADAAGMSLETPSGTINGSNDTFTLSVAPDPSADLLLFKNGLLMKQTDDYTLSSTTIVFVTAQIPPTGSTLLACIPVAPGGGGGGAGAEIVAYQEFTSPVSVTATTEGGADTVVTAPAFTADGSSTYLIEFWAPSCTPGNVTGRNLNVVLYEDGSSIGLFGGIQTPANANANQTMKSERYMVPASGSRTYAVKAMVNAGTGIVAAGTGGTGNEMPGFIVIKRVA